MTEPFRARAALPDDLPEVLGILTEASDWERSRGMPDPWPRPFPPAIVRPCLARGEVYLFDLGPDRAVATVNLAWRDLEFWGDRPDDAGYVHRLAVRRAWAGQGLGSRILRWASEEVRSRSRAYLRLDCLRANDRLVRYYLGEGFAPAGEVEVEGLRCLRFERSVSRAPG